MALFGYRDVSAILHCKNMQTMNISAIKEKGKARIEIKGTIAGWRDSERNFTRSVEDMIREGIKDVHLYINSPGGDCFEANEIVNVIRKFPGKITGEGGALVASAATYIAIHCEEFIMPENGLFMIHQPRGYANGTQKQVKSYLELLEKMSGNYYQAYLKKTTMKEEDFKEKWEAGDFWMNAKEAKKYGFATQIEGKASITTASAKEIAEAGYTGPVAITEITNPLNNEEMELNALLVQFGMPANTTEDKFIQTVSEWKRKAERTEMLEKKEEERQSAEIESLLNKAILEKRITADTKDDWKETLESNFETGKRMLESLTPVVKPTIKVPASKGTTEKTFEQLQDEDPEALARLESEDPEAFQALYNDYVKRNKV